MSTNSIPLSVAPQPNGLKTTFERACGQFAADLKCWFLPHLLASAGIFMVVAHATALSLFASWDFSFKWLAIFLLLALYGVLALGYSAVTSGLFALRLACRQWDSFLEEVLTQVQDRAVAQVTDWEVGLSKPQAQAVVRGSVREVFSARPASRNGLGRLFVFIMAGITSAALRAVLFAKIAKWSGKTIQISKLFAGKATLAGAVLLNLHFFTTLLLWLCYAVGGAILVVNIYFVFLLK